MKKPRSAFARSLTCSGLLGILSRACLATVPVVVAATSMVACADENDPKTWVKRLDDPAQRAPAIKRLDEMFNAAMGSSSNNREDPKVKAVVDDAAEALAKTYTAGGLDEKTRKDLIKLIADMGDPRGGPAFAKAFKDYEPGKNDEDVKFAAQGTSRLSTSGKLTDQSLIDALWDCFTKFQPSKAKSINLVKDLQSAVKTVKHPSWGPKAVALLSAPVLDPKNPEQGMDQLQFWQLTAVQLIGDTKFTAGVGPLVKVLMTPTKKDLTFPVRLALHKMPKEAEPELIKALKGDGDYAKLAEAYPEQAHLPLLAEPLAYISRPAGLAAITEALSSASNDQNRTILATYLTYFPTEPKNVKAYTDAYAKVAPNAAIPLMGGANGHAILAGTAANFFDPSLTEWLLKEVANAKGEAADAMPVSALPAAIKLMTVEQAKAVGDAVNKIPGQAIEKDMFKSANEVLEKCKKDAACYLSVLDTPVPSSPPAAKMGHVKAVWMAVELHPESTKVKLLERVEKVKDGSVRLAILEGIDTLSPQGDAAVADKLEKLVETDRAAGNAAGTDEMYRIALKLRSRVP
ncbi:MAG TPA: hypothetical protein VM580_24610 [Labilithrix sp.]|nr:hypothetical protein [Labilithrix sp.]